jgi:hypothetical protein
MTTMMEVEPQPRIDTLVRSGQTGAIVDAAATFTDDWPTWIQVHVNGHLGLPAGVGYRVVALTPLGAVR